MNLTITDHHGEPLTVNDTVDGNPQVPNRDELARITTTAWHYARNSGKPTRVFWNDRHQQWWWDADRAQPATV
ncbi:hypothetical protein ABZY58_11080 [Micromonospora tulbaghiae]|uniref:hypothetical protein n=1 Tax=Micromonospora tulbaghiae TaxID=479978 RepID=UPI00339E611B